MSRQIGLIHLFYCPYYHKAAGYRIFIFVLPFLPGPYKEAISLSSWQLHNPLLLFVLQNLTHIYIVNISSNLPRKYLVLSSCNSTNV